MADMIYDNGYEVLEDMKYPKDEDSGELNIPDYLNQKTLSLDKKENNK